MAVETRRPFHILTAEQFNRSWLDSEFFPHSRRMQQALENGEELTSLRGKVMALLFYEPSTRTRLSFDMAAKRLGGMTSPTENAREYSSAIKGENKKDTARTVAALEADVIVVRSDKIGGAKEMADVVKIPVINAGDGPGEHPTQALLDIYTINNLCGGVDGLHITIVGDLLNGRTARSLAKILAIYGDAKPNYADPIRLSLVAPKGFQMKPDILHFLDDKHIEYQQVERLTDVAGEADIIYMTRLQTERLWWLKKLPLPVQYYFARKFLHAEDVSINEEVMSLMKCSAKIMHPLPRSVVFNEIPEEYTDDPRVVIFKQVEYGLHTRMALLEMVA